MPTTPAVKLPFSVPSSVRCLLHGIIKSRLEANLEQWLLVAPQANPAMLEMFRDRERLPRRDLLCWSGEFAGKYLTSAVLCYRLDRDERLRRQIDRFVDELIACQAADGYLGPFPQNERLVGHTLDGKNSLWDLWGHYHCILGLLLWHREIGYPAALGAACRAADYICSFFARRSLLDAGWPEMNLAIAHGMALLYQETGEARYLAMLRQVEVAWQAAGAGDYVRTALAGTPFYDTPRPRWESLHDIQAILSLYEITGNQDYRTAFEHIWRSILSGDRHNTGGFSSGEQATGNPYDPRAVETCCTVAWMALSTDMLRLTGDPAVADELELSTYNAALGAQHPSGRWWTYNTPMDGVRKASAHEIVFQAREGSPELNCCAVNGPRSLGLISEWALLEHTEGLALNYYGPSAFSIARPSGNHLRLTIYGDYPLKPEVEIVVESGKLEEFTLLLRIPAWSKATQVWLNEVALDVPAAGQYLALKRAWPSRTRIKIAFDFSLRTWLGERECAGKASLYRGPLLLAYDRRYNSMDPDAVPPLDPANLAYELKTYRGSTPAPLMLLSFKTVTGRELVLCDFASAGSCGTPYKSWLPVA
ncbi:MAG: beta-L-arabinofuranosidase domain-containing protein [Anaerolineae bacterium]